MTETTLAQLLHEASRLAAEAADAASRGDVDTALRLHTEAEATGRRARRLGQRRSDRAAVSPRGPSSRQRAIAALTELGVACSPREIAAYAAARMGEPFDVRALASIRRDERRSWNSGTQRDCYIVPTLEGPWLVAGRGRFGLSHWPLWQRIVGPLSPRADHLRACRNLVEQAERLRPLDAGAGERLGALLAQYARSIPGALEQPWRLGAQVNHEHVLIAVEHELDLIGEQDEIWRQQQAERAHGQLSEEQRAWGATPPHAIEVGDD
ncbi:MAG TPA: hypothetical protein VLK58_07605 [Conexibacter sp.]|nr:hypothetical protein [Conexibacter sp.]